MTLDDEVRLDYSDVLMVPRLSNILSRADVSLEFTHPNYPNNLVPIMAANMDHVGTIEMSRALSKYKCLTCLTKFISLEKLAEHWATEPEVANYSVYSLGATGEDFAKLEAFLKLLREHKIKEPAMYCIDVANGYLVTLPALITQVRSLIGEEALLMIGNVVTAESFNVYYASGADIIKIGVGPGSMCTTRLETGIGYPQFSAVYECSNYIKCYSQCTDLMICADGGITCPGDAAKAFGAGASFVMIGGEFAGHDEGYSDLHDSYTKLPFYGMASTEAQKKYGSKADYRSSEGVKVEMERRGPISNTIQRYMNGLRSSCAYLGARTIDDMWHRSRFVRVNNQMDRRYK